MSFYKFIIKKKVYIIIAMIVVIVAVAFFKSKIKRTEPETVENNQIKYSENLYCKTDSRKIIRIYGK